jgi:hypothetical protein
MKLRNANKAQLAIFIIIGVVMISAILILVFLSQYIEAVESNGVFPEINTYINNIHKNALTCTIYTLGKNGGFQEEQLGLATLNEAEEVASNLMPTLINPNWGSFPQHNIEQNLISAKINLAMYDVSALITNDFIVTKDQDVMNFKDFTTKTLIRYAHIHEVADILDKDEGVNLNELADVDLDKDIKIGNTTTFKFTDKQSKIDQKSYEFFFTK